ncbi:MAG: hypothetical protein MHM6MM_002988 [Cercozoa sp. M6MM]
MNREGAVPLCFVPNAGDNATLVSFGTGGSMEVLHAAASSPTEAAAALTDVDTEIIRRLARVFVRLHRDLCNEEVHSGNVCEHVYEASLRFRGELQNQAGMCDAGERRRLQAAHLAWHLFEVCFLYPRHCIATQLTRWFAEYLTLQGEDLVSPIDTSDDDSFWRQVSRRALCGDVASSANALRQFALHVQHQNEQVSQAALSVAELLLSSPLLLRQRLQEQEQQGDSDTLTTQQLRAESESWTIVVRRLLRHPGVTQCAPLRRVLDMMGGNGTAMAGDDWLTRVMAYVVFTVPYASRAEVRDAVRLHATERATVQLWRTLLDGDIGAAIVAINVALPWLGAFLVDLAALTARVNNGESVRADSLASFAMHSLLPHAGLRPLVAEFALTLPREGPLLLAGALELDMCLPSLPEELPWHLRRQTEWLALCETLSVPSLRQLVARVHARTLLWHSRAVAHTTNLVTKALEILGDDTVGRQRLEYSLLCQATSCTDANDRTIADLAALQEDAKSPVLSLAHLLARMHTQRSAANAAAAAAAIAAARLPNDTAARVARTILQTLRCLGDPSVGFAALTALSAALDDSLLQDDGDRDGLDWLLTLCLSKQPTTGAAELIDSDSAAGAREQQTVS